MEQILLGSANVARAAQPHETGTLDLFDLIRQVAAAYPKAVEGIEELPDGILQLQWADFPTPRPIIAACQSIGKQITNGRLLDYPFQVLGGFLYNGTPVQGYDWLSPDSAHLYECFDTVLHGRLVHKTPLSGNGACNCSWLLQFLLQPATATAQPGVRQSLRWRTTFDDYQLTLTAVQGADREAHQFIFSKDFRYMKWEQHASIWATAPALP